MADETDQKPGDAPADDENGFAAAFDARTKGEEVAGGQDADTGADAPAKQDSQEPVNAASEADGKQPAATPGSDTLDPWAGMSDAQKAHWEKVQHSEQSQRGRVAALTRKQQASLSAQPAPTAEPAAPASSEDNPPAKKSSSSERAEKIRQAAEEYPDAVGALVEEIADIRGQLDKQTATVQPLVEQQDAATLTKAYADLEKAHPDYRDIGNDPSYAAWVGDKSDHVKAMANSYDVADVSMVLSLFKAEREAAIQSTQADAGKDANALRRERQLDGSKAVSSRGAPAAAGTPDDFGAAFSARAAQAR